MFFYLFPSLHICVCVCDDFSKEWKSLYLVSVLWYLNWLERDLNDKKYTLSAQLTVSTQSFLSMGLKPPVERSGWAGGLLNPALGCSQSCCIGHWRHFRLTVPVSRSSEFQGWLLKRSLLLCLPCLSTQNYLTLKSLLFRRELLCVVIYSDTHMNRVTLRTTVSLFQNVMHIHGRMLRKNNLMN